MADVHAAVIYTLHLEDSTLSGRIVTDPHDSGGATRYGIAERWHPELVPLGYFTDTMNPTRALTVALLIYTTQYATPLLLSQFMAQSIASSLLASAVNIGLVSAAKILQRALGVEDDGEIGPTTIAAANEVDSSGLLTQMIGGQIAGYQAIAAHNPAKAVFLQGWINRANAAHALDQA